MAPYQATPDREPCFCASGKTYRACHGKSHSWDGFTDDELSMILSHIAGGGALCCVENADARATITESRSRRKRLADYAYEALGCSRDHTRAEPQHAKRWLAKLEASLSGAALVWSKGDPV